MVGWGGGWIGSGIQTEIDGGIFGGSVFPEHLLELERVVVGKEDVVVREGGILAFHPQKNDEAGNRPIRLGHLGGDFRCVIVLDQFLICTQNIAVMENQVSGDLFP